VKAESAELRSWLATFRNGVLSTSLCAAIVFIALTLIHLALLASDFVSPPGGKSSLFWTNVRLSLIVAICVAGGHIFGLLVAGQWSRSSPRFRVRLPIWTAVLSVTIAILAMGIVPRSWGPHSALGLFAVTAALITAALPLAFPRWIITTGRSDE